QEEPVVFGLGGLVDVIDALGVERGRTADETVHLVALGQQQFGQVAAVLSGDTGDEGALASCGFSHCGESPRTRPNGLRTSSQSSRGRAHSPRASPRPAGGWDDLTRAG